MTAAKTLSAKCNLKHRERSIITFAALKATGGETVRLGRKVKRLPSSGRDDYDDDAETDGGGGSGDQDADED